MELSEEQEEERKGELKKKSLQFQKDHLRRANESKLMEDSHKNPNERDHNDKLADFLQRSGGKMVERLHLKGTIVALFNLKLVSARVEKGAGSTTGLRSWSHPSSWLLPPVLLPRR